jgi:hypothetical protein
VVSLACISDGRRGGGPECGCNYLCGTHLVLLFSDDGPSNGASMWVAPKCRAKAMPVVCASNGDTEALLWCFGAAVEALRVKT